MNSNIRIDRLVLRNYRNHHFLRLNLQKDIVVIYGRNGSGKTNILEAISLLDSPTGFRNANLSEIINDNLRSSLELFGINFKIFSNGLHNLVGLGLKKNYENYKKILRINEVQTNFDYIKKSLSVFWMVPRMSYLFQDSAEDRRNFIDLMISCIDLSHKKKISVYNRYKRERMKIIKANKNFDNDWLKIIEKKMASVGVMLCDARRNFLKEINSNFDQIHSGMPSLRLEMNGELDKALISKPALEVEESFFGLLEKNRKKDALVGRTNYSANKTDLTTFEKEKKKFAKNFSTGEQKIIILSIILSFIKYLKYKNAVKIIFLLDDIFSYLDLNYISLILEELAELRIQTWITDVKADWIQENNQFFRLIDRINIDDKRFKLTNNNIY